ncbi:RHS repeat-associated core domain-containing protein [Pseudomonas sp. NPDC086251]|uniref:RHS repeat-associated core domain-containing protein n=1 Tax=Pseudomonas sp. NPDC086251 TaxID=3364431 RepID=UPI003832E819
MTQTKQEIPSLQRVVLLATNSSHSIIGEIVDGKTNTIAYSTYGEQSAQQDVATRMGFNGQLREGNIGWYLLGNGYRAYNPRLMRFHSPDSWSPFGGGGLNAYMYCVGDPVNRSDPTGHNPFVAVGLYAKHKLSKAYSGYKPHPDFNVNLDSATSGLYEMQKILKFEKTHGASAASKSASYIFGPKPGNKFIGKYPSQGEGNNNTSGSVFSRNISIPMAIVATARRSHAPRRPLQVGKVAASLTTSDLPPTYEQATSGKKYWTYDTLAAAMQPNDSEVNRMAVDHMDNLGAAAPYQAPAALPPTPPPTPPRAVPPPGPMGDELRQALAEIEAMERDMLALRRGN